MRPWRLGTRHREGEVIPNGITWTVYLRLRIHFRLGPVRAVLTLPRSKAYAGSCRGACLDILTRWGWGIRIGHLWYAS